MLTRTTQFVTQFAAALLEFIYPQFCLLCAIRLNDGAKHVCDDCWQKLPRIDSEAHALQAIVHNDNLANLFSLWPFGEDVQRIIHELKYNRMLSLGKRIGHDLGELLSQSNEYIRADLIAPIPLHKVRLRERGYNQSLVIAKAMGKVMQIPVLCGIVARCRNTQSQAKLNAAEREQNMSGAFRVPDSDQVAGRTILLVDDVCTTGATLNGCAGALRSAGAVSIMAVTAARTL